MIVLAYDVETSGLPLFKEPSSDPRQPHIVQLAACLLDTQIKEVIASVDVIVKPEGWEIPAEVAAIHGITTARALEVGIREETAVEMLLELYRGRLRIAHNEAFDARIVRIALLRHRVPLEADQWKAGAAECTMALSTPILKLPPTGKMVAAGRDTFKRASLAEAYRYFIGDELVGAHRAMADVRACMAVWFAIKRLGSAA